MRGAKQAADVVPEAQELKFATGGGIWDFGSYATTESITLVLVGVED